MKGIVYTGPQQVEVVDDLREPDCGPDEVVVRMLGVGLCGSDLSVYDGHRELPSLPWVMGHEGGGEVVAVGSGVSGHRVGDRVVVEPNYACMQCGACRSGATSDCKHRRIVGMNFPGLMAERVAVPAEFALPVPAEWPVETLASFEPLAVARSAVRRSGVPAGERCLVIGAGSQGLLVCLALLARGCQPFVTDPHEGRSALAEKLGAQRAELTDETYPYVFETAGPPAAFRSALRFVASTGTVTLIGLSNEPVELATSDIVRRGLTLIGSIIYDHPADFSDTRGEIEGGVAPQRVLHEGIRPDRAAEAFAQARTVPGKSWIDLTRW